MTQAKDKIIIDLSDSPELEEFFSRKEPGDTVAGTFKGTIDETGTELAVLSITEINPKQSKPAETPEPEEAAPASAAAAMFGKGMDTEAESE